MRKINKKELLRFCLVEGATMGVFSALQVFVPKHSGPVKYVCGELAAFGLACGTIGFFNDQYDQTILAFELLAKNPKSLVEPFMEE